jgi:hypothetical protein
MSGSYTIGGASSDFDSISHAVDSLISNGVSGSVIFNIRPGTYEEQLIIPEIFGASAANTITFQSESGNAEDVIWQYAPTFTKDYIVLLDDADFIRFFNIHFYSGLLPGDYSTGIRFINEVDDIQISGNIFFGNDERTGALIFDPDTEPGSPNHLTITNNEFYDFEEAAIKLNGTGNHVGVIISGNTIYDPQSYFGITIDNYDSLSIENNMVTAENRTIRSNGCKNRIIRNNKVFAKYYGIEIAGGGGGAGPLAGLVANNMIVVGSSDAGGGIWLNGNISGLKVFHNTVFCTEPVLTGGAALLLSQPSSLQGAYRIINNIFIHSGAGLAIKVQNTGTNFELDHNDFYSNGVNLANWLNTLYTDLTSLQSASGQNLNSVSKWVDFKDPIQSDFHIVACSIGDNYLKGIGLPEVPLDFDGQIRDLIDPYMGADETFDSPPNLFTSRQDYGLDNSHRFDSGDVDGDGDIDLAIAVAPQINGEGGVTFLFNDGTGYFSGTFELPFNEDDGWRVEAADLDGDDNIDFIVPTDDTVWISWNIGGGVYTQPEYFPSCPSCLNDDVTTEDLDNDDDLDLFFRYFGQISPEDSGSVIDYLNLGNRNFYPTSYVWPDAVLEHPAIVRFADFNNDSYLDLLLSDYINSRIAIQFNLGIDGSGEWMGFDDGNTYSVSNKDIFAADFDGDDNPDVITQKFYDIQNTDSLILLRNTGNGTLGIAEMLDTDGYREPDRFIPLDYEGDGDIDIVTANITGDISLLLNDGTGNFTRVVACDSGGTITGITYFKDILTDDFNNDGKPDIALLWSDSGSDTISVYLNAGWIPTGIESQKEDISTVNGFELLQNYPNPFNPSTIIQYSVPTRSSVMLKIYDILGSEVTTLINEEKDRGVYSVNFDASGLASGIYLYRLQAGSFVQTKKMILLK